MTDVSFSGRDSRIPNPRFFSALTTLLVVAGCAHNPKVELLAASIGENTRLLSFATSCAEELTIGVEETNDVVRVSEFDGKPIDGDCLGGITVELSAPLGKRSLVIGSEIWAPLEPTCPLGNWGPQSVARRHDC
jgi:hypothetical protein